MAFKKQTTKPVATTTVDDGKQALHDEAVRMVKNQHGKYVTRLDNYDELVFDAKNQIQKSIEDSKTF